MNPEVKNLLLEISATLHRLEMLNAQLQTMVGEEAREYGSRGGAGPTMDAPSDLLAGLTPREKEVLHFIVRGETNRTTADLLNISPRTIEVYRSRIMKKVGVRNTVELVRAVLANTYGSS